MPPSVDLRLARRLRTAVLLSALVGCSAGPAPMTADAAPRDAEDATAPDAVTTPDVNAPDALPDVAPDVAPACVDISGAWEWVVTCSDPRLNQPTAECFAQTGCMVTGNSGARRLEGNTLVETFMGSDGFMARRTTTFTGDRAMSALTVTVPFMATCTGMGRRVTFPDATRYCCDAGANDCGAGQRCSPVTAGSAGALYTACIPNGTTARDATCTRTMPAVLGTDDCVAGTTCSNLSQRSPTQRTCQQTCTAQRQCAAGEACRVVVTTPILGLCRPPCALLGSDCPAGSACRTIATTGAATDDPPQYGLSCEFYGARTEGMACATHTDCAADLICEAMRGLSRACRRPCDAAHACPGGLRCAVFAADNGLPLANPRGLGMCVPMTM